MELILKIKGLMWAFNSKKKRKKKIHHKQNMSPAVRIKELAACQRLSAGDDCEVRNGRKHT